MKAIVVGLVLALLFLTPGFLHAEPEAAAVPNVSAKNYLINAKRRYEELHSYRCTATNVIMKYGVVGTVRHYNTVEYSFQKPKNIRMTWVAPLLLKGQVAVFRDNELRVKLPLMPFAVKMDPDGFLAKDPAGNRIYHTHLGYLIDALLEAITPDTKVVMAGPMQKEFLRLVIKNNQGRVLVKLDRALELPVSIEYYGTDGKLIEACYFKDIALNVSFSPGEFDLSVKAS